MKYLYTPLIWVLVTLSCAMNVNGAEIDLNPDKSLEKESYLAVKHNVTSSDSIEPHIGFFISLGIVSIGVFGGTGKSIKYFKKSQSKKIN